MKNLFTFLVLIRIAMCASAQFPVSVDSVYNFIKFNSVHQNQVDWKKTDSVFYQKLNDALAIEDTLNAFVYVLENLNDVHSQIYFNNQYYGYYKTDYSAEELEKLKPLIEKSTATTNQLKTELIMQQYAYVRVPGYNCYNQNDIDSLGQILYDTIFHFARFNPKGFIIDLRLNGGGNVYPMIAGLSLLLGNEAIAFEKNYQDSTVRTWHILNGNLFMNETQLTFLKTKSIPKFAQIPVAILIGPATRSSGSMTAIAFKKRRFVKFFGEATAAGYTTSNGYYVFADNLSMNFAVNFVADRRGVVYKNNVAPDMEIKNGDNFESLKLDTKIKAALHWFINEINKR